jgi:formate dehydrogenase maturation protein FdhE
MDPAAAAPWTPARRRAEALRGTHPFVGDLLSLYLALLDVWDEAWERARSERPRDLPDWAARHVLPRVVAATVDAGPKPLAASLEGVVRAADGAAGKLLAAWLAGAGLVPVERYLACAAMRGPLAAVDDDAAGAACAADPSPRGERRCPRCAGPPQLSFRTDTGDALVSGRRRLLCGRCGESWSFAASTCAGCGETAGDKRLVYAEQRDGPRVGRDAPPSGGAPDTAEVTYPHLRIEACATCKRYLIDVDLGAEPRAVPEADELAALPLDLYAAGHGLTKITPNVMGF